VPEKPFETGDVVWSPDPYHTDDPELAGAPAPRPWLILSTTKYPNQGGDYIACALTSNTRADEKEA
jgi:mRNA-degrading endonuclease toxin of MazEF toxin-antitoxin module